MMTLSFLLQVDDPHSYDSHDFENVPLAASGSGSGRSYSEEVLHDSLDELELGQSASVSELHTVGSQFELGALF